MARSAKSVLPKCVSPSLYLPPSSSQTTIDSQRRSERNGMRLHSLAAGAAIIASGAVVQQCSPPPSACAVISYNHGGTHVVVGGAPVILTCTADPTGDADVTIANNSGHTIRVHELGVHWSGGGGTETKHVTVNIKVRSGHEGLKVIAP